MNKLFMAEIFKIKSPIITYFDDKSKEFTSGKEFSEFEFDKNYIIDEINVKENKILIKLKDNDLINNINWNGERPVSFFE